MKVIKENKNSISVNELRNNFNKHIIAAKINSCVYVLFAGKDYFVLSSLDDKSVYNYWVNKDVFLHEFETSYELGLEKLHVFKKI